MEEMKNVFDKILYYGANHYITMATEKNLYKALHNLNKKGKLSDLNGYLVRSGLIVGMEKWKGITREDYEKKFGKVPLSFGRETYVVKQLTDVLGVNSPNNLNFAFKL